MNKTFWFYTIFMTIICLIGTVLSRPADEESVLVACSHVKVRPRVEKFAREVGGDPRLIFEAFYGLCMADNSEDDKLEAMWKEYANYYVKLVVLKKELAAYRADDSVEEGGRH